MNYVFSEMSGGENMRVLTNPRALEGTVLSLDKAKFDLLVNRSGTGIVGDGWRMTLRIALKDRTGGSIRTKEIVVGGEYSRALVWECNGISIMPCIYGNVGMPTYDNDTWDYGCSETGIKVSFGVLEERDLEELANAEVELRLDKR